MNRRKFLLATLIAPFAAAFTPVPQFALFSNAHTSSLSHFCTASLSSGFESEPLEPLSAKTIKKAWKDLADAAYKTRQHDYESLLTYFP